HLPTGSRLAAAWATRFQYPFQDTENLARVMQYVATTQYAGDADSLKQRLVSEYFSEASTPDFGAPYQVHRVLADCELPLYVTTNYDDFMFTALARTPGRLPRRDISAWYVSALSEKPPSSPLAGRG